MSHETPHSDLPPTTDPPLLAGRYQLFEKIGEGGMGAVWRARDLHLNRFVAIKLLPAGKLQDSDAVARFRREALALAQLSHPNIIQAYDSGQDGEKHFLVMELVEGRSLAAELADKGRLPPTRAADYVRQAALALHHAHKLGLVHRDVKPSNLLLDAEGRVKLLDLGLARFLQDQIGDGTLTHEGAGMGTPDYCSPEQFRDAHKADARSDIYSLGCTLYHLIAGRPPFPGSSWSEKAKAHQAQEPSLEEIAPDMPSGLVLTLARMLAKRPADRFANMGEVIEALTPYVASSSASLRELRTTVTWNGGQLSTVTDPLRRRTAMLKIVVAAALLLALIAAANMGYVLVRGRRPQIASSNAAGESNSSDRAIEDSPEKKLSDKKDTEAPSKFVRDDPNLLTVSKDPKDKGEFRSIGEAVAAVDRANMTIRVLDDAKYSERLLLRDRTNQAGLTLEAPKRATLILNTPNNAAVTIAQVPRVTIRGFKIQLGKPLMGVVAGVGIRGDSPGTIVEDLEITSETALSTFTIGVTVEHVRLMPNEPPIIVQDCTISRCKNGIQISGMDLGSKRPMPSNRVVLRRNRVEKAELGIVLGGQLNDIHVVANRISTCLLAGIRLSDLLEGSNAILVANNSIVNPHDCLQVQESIAPSPNIRIRNNYFLVEAAPDISVDAKARPVIASWQVDHNARPIFANRSAGRAAPLPPTQDLTVQELGSPTSLPKPSDDLRPSTNSTLATAGVGSEDPSLPTYIGAVPPKDALPWDWDRTWRMPKGALLLTVSQEKKNGGKYRTINDALKDAKRWATIRVLDNSEYQESISLKDKAKFEGLTLEAPKRAALVMAKGVRRGIDIRGIPYLHLGGFRIRDLDPTPMRGRACIFATGDLTGATIAGFDIKIDTYAVGIDLQQVASDVAPLVVTRCSIDTLNDGITVTGNAAVGVCRGIRLSANHVRSKAPGARGILLVGALEYIQVAGNVINDCKSVGLQIEDPAPSILRVLLANNTVCNCGVMGFRLYESRTAKKHVERSVELSNNLLFGCGMVDAAYFISREAIDTPGDLNELLQSWCFHCNNRDMLANSNAVSIQIPRSGTDRALTEFDLVSMDPQKPDRIRPGPKSPLATFGINGGAGLPAYVGAQPPEGVQPWDWDRTWRTRMRPSEK